MLGRVRVPDCRGWLRVAGISKGDRGRGSFGWRLCASIRRLLRVDWDGTGASFDHIFLDLFSRNDGSRAFDYSLMIRSVATRISISGRWVGRGTSVRSCRISWVCESAFSRPSDRDVGAVGADITARSGMSVGSWTAAWSRYDLLAVSMVFPLYRHDLPLHVLP